LCNYLCDNHTGGQVLFIKTWTETDSWISPVFLRNAEGDRRDNEMHKIVFLGKKPGDGTSGIDGNQPADSIIHAESFAESLRYLTEKEADILLVSRDSSSVRPDDLLRIRESGLCPVCIIWPPDEDLVPIISRFALSDTRRTGEEIVSDSDQSEKEILIHQNQELCRRIHSLEAMVRSLLTALSRYDLSYEAYTADDAWQLIMQGIPGVDRIGDEFEDDEQSDEEDELYDGTDGN
jgi:hypothetical protein